MELDDAVRVLALNGGSSSLKLAVFDSDERLAVGEVEAIGSGEARAWLELGDKKFEQPGPCADHAAAVAAAFTLLQSNGLGRPDAVGHRLVHGGPSHAAPERVDAALMDSLRLLVPFAPLHLPAELQIIEAVTAHFGELPQVVCFDTAFHHALPAVAQRFPLPRSFSERGIRRYGFHGLSYEFVVESLGAARLGRAVLAHLGSGASMAAVKDGAPIDTTMGLTPTGGFMMGTRTGDLDPGLLVHLLTLGYDSASLEKLVNHQSGLLGVSGQTADMKTLLARRDGDGEAALAVDLFCYQAKKSIGALAAALGGIDSLVFTGGIGERAAPVRAQICDGLSHLGVQLDAALNGAGAPIISSGACAVHVIVTDEERMLARHTRRMLSAS